MSMIFKSTYRLIGVVTIVSVATIMGCKTNSGSSSSSDAYAPSDYKSKYFNLKTCRAFYETTPYHYEIVGACKIEICAYLNCLHKACFAPGAHSYCIGHGSPIEFLYDFCSSASIVLSQCMVKNAR